MEQTWQFTNQYRVARVSCHNIEQTTMQLDLFRSTYARTMRDKFRGERRSRTAAIVALKAEPNGGS